MRWLGDKSVACSQALPPGRVPQVRTSVPGKKKTGAKPAKAFISRSRFSYPWSESIRKKPFSTQVRWCEPGAPVQGSRLVGKAGKRRTKGQPTAKQRSRRAAARRLLDLRVFEERTLPPLFLLPGYSAARAPQPLPPCWTDGDSAQAKARTAEASSTCSLLFNPNRFRLGPGSS
jgi:hypothetical protein